MRRSSAEPTSAKAGAPASDLRKDAEEIAERGRAGGVAEQRPDSENLLERPEQRAVRIADRVGISAALRSGGKHDQADGAIAAFALVPDDAEGSAARLCGRAQDHRDPLREPPVPAVAV